MFINHDMGGNMPVKKLAYILLSLVMLAAAVLPSSAFAVSKEEVDEITTPHLILFEPESQTVLYEKNAYTKAFPASTTKIMTFVVVMDHCDDLDREYTCGDESWKGFYDKSSLLGLKPGYRVTIRDMLYGLMLCSGNDCGACLAVATCGSVEGFVELMNRKAEELNMTGTHYTNPHGLHDDEHYTTALDMALLMTEALKNDFFREVIKTTEYTIRSKEGKLNKTIQTSNKLLLTKPGVDWDECIYEYAIGGKTGETNIAGYTLVEAAEKDGITLIAVLMGDSNQGNRKFYDRFHNAVKLFEYGFDQYVSYELSDFDVTNEFNVQTVGYPADDPAGGRITAEVDISGARLKGFRDKLADITPQSFAWGEPELDQEACTAPITKGEKLGTATLYLNGKPFFTGDLVAAQDIAGATTPGPTKQPDSFIDDKSQTRSGGVCNLTVSKNGGEDEYTVWVYYKNNLFTLQDAGTVPHYLFAEGDQFRAAKAPSVPYGVRLYYASADEEGGTKYLPADVVIDGESYVIVSEGRALQAVKKGKSLAAVPVEINENGELTTPVSDDMLWSFTKSGVGYKLRSNGLTLHRSGGDGLIFWILIGVFVIAIAIIIRLLATSRSRRRNPKRRGKYKIYRM